MEHDTLVWATGVAVGVAASYLFAYVMLRYRYKWDVALYLQSTYIRFPSRVALAFVRTVWLLCCCGCRCCRKRVGLLPPSPRNQSPDTPPVSAWPNTIPSTAQLISSLRNLLPYKRWSGELRLTSVFEHGSTTLNTNINKPYDKSAEKTAQPLLIKETEGILILGMVGLPARGKSYIACKTARYLAWLGYKVKIFNVGSYRRKMCGVDLTSDFFNPDNAKAAAARVECAKSAIQDLSNWFTEYHGQIAILDATNSTRKRRRWVAKLLQNIVSEGRGQLVWLESICNDQRIIESNIIDTKLFSPDYHGIPRDVAVEDFKMRLKNYERVYETLSETELTHFEGFVKLINCGTTVVSHCLRGYLPGRVCFYLANLRLAHAPIYLTRHGQSVFNTLGKIGGDSSLSPLGRSYAKALAQFIREEDSIDPSRPYGRVGVWCSNLQRTIITAAEVCRVNGDRVYLGRAQQMKVLAEIDAGVFDGLTYQEIRAIDPEGFQQRQDDKLRWRYPQGESYVDLIDRLESVIFELERARGPILVIAHQAVVRCLYGYFLDLNPEELPYLSVPLHTVVKLTPKAYITREERLSLLESEAGTTPVIPRRASEVVRSKDNVPSPVKSGARDGGGSEARRAKEEEKEARAQQDKSKASSARSSNSMRQRKNVVKEHHTKRLPSRMSEASVLSTAKSASPPSYQRLSEKAKKN